MTQRRTILIICTGNTCRSPMAEGLLRAAIAQEPRLKRIEVVSAGTATRAGEKASEHSINAVKGIADISKHKSQVLSQALIDEAIAIFYMTESHRQALQRFQSLPEHVYAWRGFLSTNAVPDPFGQGFSAYQKTKEAILEAIPSLIEFLKTKDL
ncbi:MAG: hypothetical protein A2Y14_02250 [Verrucomicrobia bacterium GWF2_51_19]|nr:MAG: hypothetical protein A2Y14_02250 [Verrucomicrobia bacterium GWF2_51_19]HCJ12211.1 protein tyrosine phosphatase [Opitutae bacterium]